MICVFVPCISHAFASVHCCLVVTCWERADLLALADDVYRIFVTFSMVGGALLYCFQIFAVFLTLFCLFDLTLYVPSAIFQLNRDRPSWVEPVLN